MTLFNHPSSVIRRRLVLASFGIACGQPGNHHR